MMRFRKNVEDVKRRRASVRKRNYASFIRRNKASTDQCLGYSEEDDVFSNEGEWAEWLCKRSIIEKSELKAKTLFKATDDTRSYKTVAKPRETVGSEKIGMAQRSIQEILVEQEKIEAMCQVRPPVEKNSSRTCVKLAKSSTTAGGRQEDIRKYFVRRCSSSTSAEIVGVMPKNLFQRKCIEGNQTKMTNEVPNHVSKLPLSDWSRSGKASEHSKQKSIRDHKKQRRFSSSTSAKLVGMMPNNILQRQCEEGNQTNMTNEVPDNLKLPLSVQSRMGKATDGSTNAGNDDTERANLESIRSHKKQRRNQLGTTGSSLKKKLQKIRTTKEPAAAEKGISDSKSHNDETLRQNTEMKSAIVSTSTPASSCEFCWDATIEGAFVSCGHMAGCMTCLNKIEANSGECPFCRTKLDMVVRLYRV